MPYGKGKYEFFNTLYLLLDNKILNIIFITSIIIKFSFNNYNNEKKESINERQ